MTKKKQRRQSTQHHDRRIEGGVLAPQVDVKSLEHDECIAARSTADKPARLEQGQHALPAWIQAYSSVVLVIITLFLALYARDQIKQTRAAVEVSDDLGKAAARQFRVSERPWLSADVRVLVDLAFDEHGVGSIGVEVVLHNSGKTPAINARVIQHLVGDTMDVFATTSRQEALCGPLRNETVEIGNTIFPGRTEPYPDMVRIRKEDIAESVRRNEALWSTPPGNEGLAKWRGKLSPGLITCIDYRSSVTGQHHQTRYFFMVGPRADAFSMSTALAPIGVYRDTKLWRMFFGQYAD